MSTLTTTPRITRALNPNHALVTPLIANGLHVNHSLVAPRLPPVKRGL